MKAANDGVDRRCPLSGVKRTYSKVHGMSAKCQKRTLAETESPDREWELSAAQPPHASLGWMS
jgi:hypothetical protein